MTNANNDDLNESIDRMMNSEFSVIKPTPTNITEAVKPGMPQYTGRDINRKDIEQAGEGRIMFHKQTQHGFDAKLKTNNQAGQDTPDKGDHRVSYVNLHKGVLTRSDTMNNWERGSHGTRTHHDSGKGEDAGNHPTIHSKNHFFSAMRGGGHDARWADKD